MKACEAKYLADVAKAQKLNNRRTDLLKRVEAAANSGNDSLVLGEWLGEHDVEFFEDLGYSIIDHVAPINNLVSGTGVGHVNYRYSEISWA